MNTSIKELNSEKRRRIKPVDQSKLNNNVSGRLKMLLSLLLIIFIAIGVGKYLWLAAASNSFYIFDYHFYQDIFKYTPWYLYDFFRVDFVLAVLYVFILFVLIVFDLNDNVGSKVDRRNRVNIVPGKGWLYVSLIIGLGFYLFKYWYLYLNRNIDVLELITNYQLFKKTEDISFTSYNLMQLDSILFSLMLIALNIGSWFQIFKKAGKSGLLSLVPIYNIFVLIDIAGKPNWWFLLIMIPGVNIVASIWLLNCLVHRYGRNAGFTFLLVICPIIFFPMLGLSNHQYILTEKNIKN